MHGYPALLHAIAFALGPGCSALLQGSRMTELAFEVFCTEIWARDLF